jgi:hypothetical protein
MLGRAEPDAAAHGDALNSGILAAGEECESPFFEFNMFRADFQPDVEDALVTLRYSSEQSNRRAQRSARVISWIFILITYPIGFSHLNLVGRFCGAFLSVVAVYGLVMTFFRDRIMAWRIRQQFARDGSANRNRCFSVTLSDDGVSYDWDGTSATIPWKSVERIDVLAAHLCFFMPPIGAIVVPKRAFPEQAAFQDFVDTATKHRTTAVVPSTE